MFSSTAVQMRNKPSVRNTNTILAPVTLNFSRLLSKSTKTSKTNNKTELKELREVATKAETFRKGEDSTNQLGVTEEIEVEAETTTTTTVPQLRVSRAEVVDLKSISQAEVILTMKSLVKNKSTRTMESRSQRISTSRRTKKKMK